MYATNIFQSLRSVEETETIYICEKSLFSDIQRLKNISIGFRILWFFSSAKKILVNISAHYSHLLDLIKHVSIFGN